MQTNRSIATAQAEKFLWDGYEQCKNCRKIKVFAFQCIKLIFERMFDAYMRFGGMPGIADVGLDQEKAWMLLEGIYSTVIVRDILERENRRGQKRITDSVLLRKIVLYLADNIGSNISISSIGNVLVREGLMEGGKRKEAPSAHTVHAYVNALLESYFFMISNGLM